MTWARYRSETLLLLLCHCHVRADRWWVLGCISETTSPLYVARLKVFSLVTTLSIAWPASFIIKHFLPRSRRMSFDQRNILFYFTLFALLFQNVDGTFSAAPHYEFCLIIIVAVHQKTDVSVFYFHDCHKVMGFTAPRSTPRKVNILSSAQSILR